MNVLMILIALAVGGYLLARTVRARRLTARQSGSLSALGQALEGVVMPLRFGSPLHQALAGMAPQAGSLGASEYLAGLCGALSRGLSYPEALDLARRRRRTPVDGFLHLVFSRTGASPTTLSLALDKVVRLISLAGRYERQERAKTTQSRAQFWVVSALIPLLLVFNVFFFPELVVQTLRTPVGSAAYSSATVLFFIGVWLFHELQGKTFSFLVGVTDAPKVVQQQQGWQRALAKLRAGDSVIERQTASFGFLSSLEVALVSGHNLRDALEVASHLFPGSELSALAATVLDREGKGEKLLDAFQALRGDPSEAAVQLGQIARGARERTFLVETVQVLAERSRERLGEMAEERLGAVGVQLLIPLCLGLLPAAVLMLLAPILHMLQATLGSGI